VNQINVYGYDLTTALRNAAKTSPSKRLADLFGGMVTTITTGGNLTTYLQEKSKSLLIDYRLSHERYTNVIGMYSDIYTALLIAAPLIFMLLLAIISIMGSSFMAMDITTLANLGIIIIAALNILFLIFLKFTQPEV
jgi:flagellar protein FlaJ